jgi:hypothetical protein
LFLKEARLPPEGWASFASFGKLHLWRLSEGSAIGETCFEKSASFGFLNVLREASPLAASFGKLQLWRLSQRPSGSFTSGGFLKEARLSERTFTSGGFPKEANLFRFLRLPSGSFTSGGVAAY